MPQTISGEDLVMPGALAVNLRDGRLFIASMKMGELFTLDESPGAGTAHFANYAGGLFQDAYSMLHDGESLYILHRRNLTRILDTDGDGRADRFDRVATFPHAIGNNYDWGYGLIREPGGAFLLTFAPHANQQLPGAGSLLRLLPSADGPRLEEVAYGFRNPLGWCMGPDGEVFFSDNQGDWIATSKLGHLVPGSFNGYPNHAQLQHTNRPFAPTTVWVPYDWARSINGIAWDNTGGKFGPFAGQIFMAELMNGGAIIRANVERVNGVYQGACFPFWGKGLLGPLVLAFDPAGRLYVGGITMPGWMGQPDRGALSRIEFTGETPFEMQSIHVLPHGFRVNFTAPLLTASARDVSAWRIENYRYEYTGAYGSPELDRRALPIERVRVSADSMSVELTTALLEQNRVYAITANSVRSLRQEPLLHTTGVYTLNEIPAR